MNSTAMGMNVPSSGGVSFLNDLLTSLHDSASALEDHAAHLERITERLFGKQPEEGSGNSPQPANPTMLESLSDAYTRVEAARGRIYRATARLDAL